MNHQLLVLALLIGVLPAAAHAQCEEGRVATEQTAGRCCWPGQTFESARCSGPPACPPALVAEGDDCVLRRSESVESGAAGTAIQPSSTVLMWPTTPDLSVAVLEPRAVRGLDRGLVVVGVTSLIAGYVGAIVIGIADQVAHNCRGPRFDGGSRACDSWPMAFVPVAGGILAGVTRFGVERNDYGLGMIAGPIIAILQLTGIAFLLHTAAFPTDDLIPGSAVDGARISFAPYATDTEGGAALRVDF